MDEKWLAFRLGHNKAKELEQKKREVSQAEWSCMLAQELASTARLDDSGNTEAARITTTVASLNQ